MGGKTREKKPKEKQGSEIVPKKVETPEFTKIVDIKDPWEGEHKTKIDMPTKKEMPGEVDLENEKLATKEFFAKKLAELRARMENREPGKYHRGNVAYRPRGNKKKKAVYLDRVSRLGSIAGNRPKQKKKRKAGGERENVMVFTAKELYGKEETKQLAKLDAKKKKPKKKKN